MNLLSKISSIGMREKNIEYCIIQKQFLTAHSMPKRLYQCESNNLYVIIWGEVLHILRLGIE